MKKYIKNNEIRPANQIVCKKIEQEEIEGVLQDIEYNVYNPSEEMILSDGWEIYDNSQEEYENRVIELIREKYTVNQEFAILRQRDVKPEEFDEYNSYVENCKIQAKEEIWNTYQQ
ncbi:MAG: hypothetical protein E7067_07200 [Lentimicrobiaceae bacterium]|nr:hypothetical protein [Lentimicrobiaceae bacterium]